MFKHRQTTLLSFKVTYLEVVEVAKVEHLLSLHTLQKKAKVVKNMFESVPVFRILAISI